ncbi:MAG TPA: GAF domain-containing protein, partial [Blastocatellia bacterium]|nr:GAF domain-containing protein [Blastocatellia bacterium]
MSNEEGNREGAASPSGRLMVSALSEESSTPRESRPVSGIGSRDRRAFINRLEQRVQKPVDLNHTIQASVEELGAQLKLDRCIFWTIGENGELARPTAQYCADGVEALDSGVSVADVPEFARAVSAQGGMLLSDAQTDRIIRSLYDRYRRGPRPQSVACLAIEIDGKLRGLLSLSSGHAARKWADDEIELTRIVADRLGIAIKQDELIKQLQESVREAEALYRASNLLIDTSDIDRLYEQILDAFADVFGHPNSNIWLVDDVGGEAVVKYARGEVPPNMLRRLRLDGPGLLAHCVRTASIVNIRDATIDKRYLPGLADTRSELLVPLIVEGKVIAVFNVESPMPGAFTKRDERILSTFAERAARAVDQARLYKQMQEAAARDSLISKVTRLLNQSLDAESIFQELVEELGDHLNLHRCYLASVDSRAGVVAVSHQYARSNSRLPAFLPWEECGFAYSAMGQSPLVCTDVLAEPTLSPSHKHFAEVGARGMLSAPVTIRGSVKQVIVCQMNAARKWRQVEVELVDSLAGQAAIARQRAELFLEVTASQREWEQTFDAMPEAVFVLDQNLRLTRANVTAAALQGMSEGRPAGQTCCEVIAKSTGLKECLIEKAVEAGTTIVREATPKFAARPFLFTIEPTFAVDGSSLGAIVIASDLTPIKRAEAETQKQRQFLSRLLEIARDAVFVLDLDGRFSWYNPRLSELTGYSLEELHGMRLAEILAVEPDAKNPFTRPEKLPESFEAQLKRKDSGHRYVLITSTPIYEANRLSGVLGMLHDITDVRTAVEKTAQADNLRALGQLAGGVAHN